MPLTRGSEWSSPEGTGEKWGRGKELIQSIQSQEPTDGDWDMYLHRRARGLVRKISSVWLSQFAISQTDAADKKRLLDELRASDHISSAVEHACPSQITRKKRVEHEKQIPAGKAQRESQITNLDINAMEPQASTPLLERPNAVFWLVLICLPVFVLLCFIVPPFDDELYYWCWSQELQFSYFDHPPMVAYMIRLSTMLFGQSILAIRIPCIVSALTVIAVVTWLSRPRALIPYIILSPVPTFAAIMITPDVPLLMFWALYLAWLVFMHRRLSGETLSASGQPPRIWRWILGGAIIGCGVLGKYTTGLAVVAGFVSFALMGQWRRWIVGYTVQGLTAMLVASPILIYNIQNNFASISFQWEHAMSSPEPGLFPFMEFVGIQMLFFGTLPFLAFVCGLGKIRTLIADPKLRVCACLFLIPFGFFLYKATQGRLEGNWAFPCYLACWPVVAELYRSIEHLRRWRILCRMAFALPLTFSSFLLIHAIYPLPIVPVEGDRSTRQWDKMELARVIAADLKKAGYTGPVYTFTYQWVSLLRWHGVDAYQHDAKIRPSNFSERAHPPIDPARYVVLMETATAKPEAEQVRKGRSHVYSTHLMIVRDVPGPYFHLVDFSTTPVLPVQSEKAGQLP
jgi:hypothetical protein